MISLKLAVIAATSTCAVAAAGGVTYAMVGNSSPAPSASQSSKGSAMTQDAGRVAPAPGIPSLPVPTCLPKLPKGVKLPTGKLPTDKLPTGKLTDKLPTGKLPTGKLTDKLPTGKLTDKLPTGNLGDKLPTGKLPVGKLPTGKIPTCIGDVVPGTPALPKVGQLPKLPTQGLPKADCSKLPPAINLGAAKGKDLSLPNGMHLSANHTHSLMVNGQQACANVQQFAGVAGGLLTIERLQTPPQTTVRELAQALKLASGNIASVNGSETWRSPAGDGMLAYSDKGVAVYITGSPLYTPLLPGIMSQLQVR